MPDRRLTAGEISSSDSPCWIASQDLPRRSPAGHRVVGVPEFQSQSGPVAFAVEPGLAGGLHRRPPLRDQRVRVEAEPAGVLMRGGLASN